MLTSHGKISRENATGQGLDQSSDGRKLAARLGKPATQAPGAALTGPGKNILWHVSDNSKASSALQYHTCCLPL